MPRFSRSLRFLFPMAIAFAPSAGAQSIDHAKQLFAGAKYAEAKTELFALQKVNDRNAAAAYYLGRIAMINNDGEEAILQFERAVAAEDGNALYHFWLGSAVRDEAPRANMLQQVTMVGRMRKEMERAVALDPNQVDARFALILFLSGAPSMMGGDMGMAREQAGEIAKRSPMRGAMALGVIAENEKNAAAEEAAYQKAIAAAPDSMAGYFALANVYVRDGSAADAFATLDRYLKRHPDDRTALYQTGRVAGTTGQQLDRGDAALKQYLGSPPADAYVTSIAAAHYWRGRIAEKRGNKDAAREHYEAALKINPKSAPAQKALDALK